MTDRELIVPTELESANSIAFSNGIDRGFPYFRNDFSDAKLLKEYPDWQTKPLQGLPEGSPPYTNLDAARYVREIMYDGKITDDQRYDKLTQILEMADFPLSFQTDIMLSAKAHLTSKHADDLTTHLFETHKDEYEPAFLEYVREPTQKIREQLEADPELLELIRRGSAGLHVSIDDRKKVITSLTAIISDAYGITPPEIVYAPLGANNYGKYDQHIFTVSSDKFFSYNLMPGEFGGLLNTISHELYHAAEAGLVTQSEYEFDNSNPRFVLAKLYAGNSLNYIHSYEVGERYGEINPLENHAFAYGHYLSSIIRSIAFDPPQIKRGSIEALPELEGIRAALKEHQQQPVESTPGSVPVQTLAVNITPKDPTILLS